MNLLRKMHLYLGMFLAPIILTVCISGAWQVYDLHKHRKDGSYTPPVIFEIISDIHTNQGASYYMDGDEEVKVSNYGLMAIVSISVVGIAISAMLGIILGLRGSRDKRAPIVLLLLGIGLPLLLLL